MMKVSVLVPVYGVEKYIEQCVESLFVQTYTNLEYIFVDDCSPDRSIDILKTCIERHPNRQAQVRIIHNEHNCGIGIVRQKGIDAATGEYITFVDSDDFIPPTAIQSLVAKAKSGNFDIIEGAYRKIGCKHEKNVLPQHVSSKKRLRMLLCHKGNGFIWAKLFRRSLFTDNSIGFSDQISFSEDYSVLPCLLFKGRRTWTDDVVYNYRCNNFESYTHRINLKSILSGARANVVVNHYFIKHDKRRYYRNAINLGMLTVYRDAHRHRIPLSLFSEIDKILNYHSKNPIDKLFFRMFHSPTLSFSIPDKLFSLYRKFYIYSRF